MGLKWHHCLLNVPGGKRSSVECLGVWRAGGVLGSAHSLLDKRNRQFIWSLYMPAAMLQETQHVSSSHLPRPSALSPGCLAGALPW